MRVLVTGATGYIGKRVIPALLEKGVSVIATSVDENKAKECIWFNDVEYISHRIDLNSRENLFFKFGKPDKLLHLAWGGLPNYYDSTHIENEFPAHYSFVKLLIQQGVCDVNVLGTCLEYGLQEGPMDPLQPTYPTTAYGAAKDFLRTSIDLLRKTNSFNFKWMRLFYIYSEDQPRNSIYPSLQKAISNNEPEFNMSHGNQIRDFIKADEAIDQILEIVLSDVPFLISNICSESPITVMEFVKSVISQANSKIKLNPGFYSYPDYEPMYFWGKKTNLK